MPPPLHLHPTSIPPPLHLPTPPPLYLHSNLPLHLPPDAHLPAAARAPLRLHLAGVTRIEAAVLLCHGDADPFTTPASLDACVAQLRAAGAQWRLHTYGGAPHAWTNPAQRLNSKPGFGYDRAAAEASWRATTAFLAEVLR